jgi:hypothetical protein
VEVVIAVVVEVFVLLVVAVTTVIVAAVVLALVVVVVVVIVGRLVKLSDHTIVGHMSAIYFLNAFVNCILTQDLRLVSLIRSS